MNASYISMGGIFKYAFSSRYGRYFGVVVHVLDTFIDESSDQTRKDVFCVAGFLAHEHFWKPLEERWVKRLAEDGVKYFSAKDCKSVQGPFSHLRKVHGSLEEARKVANSIRADLEDILVPPPELPPSQWHGFSLAVVIPEYNHVRDEYPESRVFYAKDPTVAAYSQIMYEIVRAVRRKAKKFGIAYIIDQSNDFKKINHAFKAMKVNHPVIGFSAKTCAPFDDKQTPGLQMADLLASVSKDISLEWLASGRKHPEIGKSAPNL